MGIMAHDMLACQDNIMDILTMAFAQVSEQIIHMVARMDKSTLVPHGGSNDRELNECIQESEKSRSWMVSVCVSISKMQKNTTLR